MSNLLKFFGCGVLFLLLSGAFLFGFASMVHTVSLVLAKTQIEGIPFEFVLAGDVVFVGFILFFIGSGLKVLSK